MPDKERKKIIPALALPRQVFFRGWVLYLLVGTVLFLWADRTRSWNHSVNCALSRYIPSYEYLDGFNQDRSRIDIRQLEEFERYFRKVGQFMPSLAEAQAMLGFCCFYEGKFARSAEAYKKAVSIYPDVFNFQYNLGLLALKNSNPRDALKFFKNSVAINPVDNAKYLITAQIYRPLLPKSLPARDKAGVLEDYTRDVYGRAYRHILALSEELKDFKAMEIYARRGLEKGYLQRGLGQYYAGRAACEFKEYAMGAALLEQAVKRNFNFAQTYNALGLCLKDMGRPEHRAFLEASANMNAQGKVYKLSAGDMELLMY